MIGLFLSGLKKWINQSIFEWKHVFVQQNIM